jgi:hypothetical protein
MTTVIDALLALNVDELSPLEALTKLAELKRQAAWEHAKTPADEVRQMTARLIEFIKTGYDMDDETFDALRVELRALEGYVVGITREFDHKAWTKTVIRRKPD